MQDVTFVVPARDEEDHIEDCLTSIQEMETTYSYEIIVVDGGSMDLTLPRAYQHDVRIVHQQGEGRATGRNLGAEYADGEYLAFIDADTQVHPDYLDEMIPFLEREQLIAATSRVRYTGDPRAKLIQLTLNQVSPRLARPVLPGFNFFIRRSDFQRTGGFPETVNEDTAYSMRLAEHGRTGVHPDVLVETSGRRVRRYGITLTGLYYLKKDLRRKLDGY